MKNLTIITFFYLLFITNVHANDNIFDKTFFSENRLDRFHFTENNIFYQQLENDWAEVKAGNLIQGNWFFKEKNSQLCLNYTTPKLNETCLNFSKENSTYSLSDAKGEKYFIWDHYKDGNWLLSVKGMNKLKLAFDGKKIIDNHNTDKQISDYYINKIFDGYGNLDYIRNGNEGILIDKNKKIIAYNWETKNLVTTLISSNNEVLYKSVITLGHEFLEPKPNVAYLYLNKDNLAIENQEFKLIDFINHPQKKLFSDYLEQYE